MFFSQGTCKRTCVHVHRVLFLFLFMLPINVILPVYLCIVTIYLFFVSLPSSLWLLPFSFCSPFIML